MSVVIIGGNECMERRYKELCRKHGCFTHTVSHKMVQYALAETASATTVVRSHTSSIASLERILGEAAG